MQERKEGSVFGQASSDLALDAAVILASEDLDVAIVAPVSVPS